MAMLLAGVGILIETRQKPVKLEPTYTLVGVNDQTGHEKTLVAGRSLKEIQIGFERLCKLNKPETLGNYFEVRMWLNGMSVNYVSHLNAYHITENLLQSLFEAKYS